MEHLWSPAGATGGNRWQMGRARKPLRRADPQPMATHGNRFAAHGKEGVDGSSPSEGFTKGQQMAFLFPRRSKYIARASLSPSPKSVPSIAAALQSWLEQRRLTPSITSLLSRRSDGALTQAEGPSRGQTGDGTLRKGG